MERLYNSIEGCVGNTSTTILNKRAQVFVNRWRERANIYAIYCRTPQEGRAFLRLMRGFIRWGEGQETDEYDPWSTLDENYTCLFLGWGLQIGTISDADKEKMLLVPVEKVLDYLYGRKASDEI